MARLCEAVVPQEPALPVVPPPEDDVHHQREQEGEREEEHEDDRVGALVLRRQLAPDHGPEVGEGRGRGQSARQVILEITPAFNVFK